MELQTKTIAKFGGEFTSYQLLCFYSIRFMENVTVDEAFAVCDLLLFDFRFMP